MSNSRAIIVELVSFSSEQARRLETKHSMVVIKLIVGAAGLAIFKCRSAKALQEGSAYWVIVELVNENARE